MRTPGCGRENGSTEPLADQTSRHTTGSLSEPAGRPDRRETGAGRRAAWAGRRAAGTGAPYDRAVKGA